MYIMFDYGDVSLHAAYLSSCGKTLPSIFQGLHERKCSFNFGMMKQCGQLNVFGFFSINYKG